MAKTVRKTTKKKPAAAKAKKIETLINQFNNAFESAEQEKEDPKERSRYFDIADKINLQINKLLPKKGSSTYHKDTMQRMALVAIVKNTCLFVTDVVVFVPISRATFYNNGLDKIDILKDAITYNKLKTKHSLRAKWYNSDNATLQIALFKLLSTDEELQRLTMNNVNIEEGAFDGEDSEELENAYFPPKPSKIE